MYLRGFGSAIFRPRTILRRTSLGQWAQLSRVFAINSLERPRTFSRRFCSDSGRLNCFIPDCASCRVWAGSVYLSYRVPVCCTCNRIICAVGTPPSTSRDRADGSDTLLPMNIVGYSATLLVHSVHFSCWLAFT